MRCASDIGDGSPYISTKAYHGNGHQGIGHERKCVSLDRSLLLMGHLGVESDLG